MNSKTIIVDVDDVTANLVDWWLEIYNLDYKDSLKETDIKSWAIHKYTKIGDKMYDYLKDPSLYDGVLPVKNSAWGIRRLRGMGHRVAFVTASTPEQAGRKYRWLQEYDMIDSRSNYIEALDKTLIKADYIIDDNPDNIVKATCQPIVFTREWNKYLGNIYPRANNWEDIVMYFTRELTVRHMTGV